MCHGTTEHADECAYGELEGKFVHVCIKLNAIIGLNEQEIEWMEECGVEVTEECDGS